MKDTTYHVPCPFHERKTYCTEKIRLFQTLPETVQQELMQSARHRTVPKGYIFADDGDEVKSIIIIRSGSVKTYRLDTSGNEYVLDVLHEAQAIWHDMFLREARYHYAIEAVTETAVCEISREVFINVIERHPKATFNLIQMLSGELTSAKEKILLLSIRSPLVRVAGFLLDQANKTTDNIIHFRLEDIASTICLRPETISRTLRSFEKKGILERKGHGKIFVKDLSQLHSIYQDSDQT